MNGAHSGNGVIKSEARKNKYKSYRTRGTREKNRDARAKRIQSHFQKKES